MNPAAKLSTLRFYGIVKKRSNPEYIRVPLYELYKTPDIDILANQEQTLNRLIVVVEAIFPENDSDAELPLHVPSFKRNIYWRQAFYLSSGSSSGLLYSWLPFNGVGVYFGKMWFIKPIMEFSSPDYSKFPQEAIEDECVKKELSDDFKIPEYPLIKRDKQNREFSSRVIRKSFLLASQDFGSFMFIDQNSMDLIIKNLGERESDEDKLMIINRIERFTNKHIPALTKERDDVPEVEGMSTLEYYNLAAKEA